MSPSRDAGSAHGARMDDRAALNAPADILQHAAHHGGHARHDEHIAELEAGGGRDRVVDQLGAVRDPRHAQAALIHLLAARLHTRAA